MSNLQIVSRVLLRWETWVGGRWLLSLRVRTLCQLRWYLLGTPLYEMRPERHYSCIYPSPYNPISHPFDHWPPSPSYPLAVPKRRGQMRTSARIASPHIGPNKLTTITSERHWWVRRASKGLAVRERVDWPSNSSGKLSLVTTTDQ